MEKMNMAEANEVASLPLTALNTCNSLLYVLPCFSYLLLLFTLWLVLMNQQQEGTY